MLAQRDFRVPSYPCAYAHEYERMFLLSMQAPWIFKVLVNTVVPFLRAIMNGFLPKTRDRLLP